MDACAWPTRRSTSQRWFGAAAATRKCCGCATSRACVSRLYLRLASSTAAEADAGPRGLACRYAVVASGKVEHEGTAALPELSAALGSVDRVTLLLAATDVTLLRLHVPPLAPARLKAALPNLVEEHLISDPAECVIVAGASADGLRTVAVVQRAWLASIANTLATQ